MGKIIKMKLQLQTTADKRKIKDFPKFAYRRTLHAPVNSLDKSGNRLLKRNLHQSPPNRLTIAAI